MMNHRFRILVVNNILQAVDTGYSNWYELIEKYVYKKLSNIYEPQTLVKFNFGLKLYFHEVE